MNTILLVLAGLVSISLFVTFYIIAVHNSIVTNKNAVKRAWATVLAHQRKKGNVLPEFERGIKEYSEFEVKTHATLTELRSSMETLKEENINTEHLQHVEQKTTELVTGLKATFEAYADLKTSDLYLRWMNELSEIESNVVAAIEIFNREVQSFNDGIQTFPANVVNTHINHEAALIEFTDSVAQAGFEYSPTQ